MDDRECMHVVEAIYNLFEVGEEEVEQFPAFDIFEEGSVRP